jgi:hypothetical protein
MKEENERKSKKEKMKKIGEESEQAKITKQLASKEEMSANWR